MSTNNKQLLKKITKLPYFQKGGKPGANINTTPVILDANAEENYPTYPEDKENIVLKKKNITVKDGDTFLYLDPETNKQTAIRIEGINANEKTQARGGWDATRALADFFNSGKEITLSKIKDPSGKSKDAYGRTVGVVKVDGKNVKDLMSLVGVVQTNDGKYYKSATYDQLKQKGVERDTIVAPTTFRDAEFYKFATTGKGLSSDKPTPESERRLKDKLSLYIDGIFAGDEIRRTDLKGLNVDGLYGLLQPDEKAGFINQIKSQESQFYSRLDGVNAETIARVDKRFADDPVKRGVSLEIIKKALGATKGTKVLPYSPPMTPNYAAAKVGLPPTDKEVFFKKDGGVLYFQKGKSSLMPKNWGKIGSRSNTLINSPSEQLEYNINFEGVGNGNSVINPAINITNSDGSLQNRKGENGQMVIDPITVSKVGTGIFSALYPLATKTTSPSAQLEYTDRAIVDQSLDTSGYRSQIANNFSNQNIREGSDLYAVNAARMNNATAKTQAFNELSQKENEFRLANIKSVVDQQNNNLKERESFNNNVAQSNFETGRINAQGANNARNQSAQNLMSFVGSMTNDAIAKKNQDAELQHYYNTQEISRVNDYYNNQALVEYDSKSQEIANIDAQLSNTMLKEESKNVLLNRKIQLENERNMSLKNAKLNSQKAIGKIVPQSIKTVLNRKGGKIGGSTTNNNFNDLNKVVLEYNKLASRVSDSQLKRATSLMISHLNNKVKPDFKLRLI